MARFDGAVEVALALWDAAGTCVGARECCAICDCKGGLGRGNESRVTG